jgi:hypothetical protein
MSELVGPDGKAPVWDGAAWVSADRRHWWNGAGWVRIKKRGFEPPIMLIGLIVLLLGAVWLVATHYPKPAPEPYGVTNTKIDSPQQFEFDYRSKTDCKDITFFYKFYDQNGKLVDQRQDEKHNVVLKDKTYHIDVANFGAGIAATAVRFDAIPTCRA